MGKHMSIGSLGICGLSIDKSTGPLTLNRLIDLSTNKQTSIYPYASYHRYKGLSSMRVGQGTKKISLISNNPIYTNTISLIWGYEGLADIKV